MIAYQRGMLQEGRFAWCGRSGMVLSDGYFWTRLNGGYNFYHSSQGPTEIDFDHPVAVCGPAEKDVAIEGVLEPGRDHWMAVKTISRYGLESTGHAWVRVRTDAENNGMEVPDQVQNLGSKIGYYGRVRLEWDYEPRMGSVRAEVFKIYVADDAGVFNFDLVEDQVAYRKNQRHYVWDSQYLIYSYPFRIIVRAVTAQGVDCGCLRYVIARADQIRPGIVEDAKAEMV